MTDSAPLLLHTTHAAATWLNSLDATPVAATVTREELRARFRSDGLRQNPTDPTAVVDELIAAARGGLIASTGGRFYGWVIGGALPSAVSADWLTTVWDQNAGLYSTSPAASVAEEVASEWLLDVLGLPATASVGFVTGCQMAHVTCLLAARHALLGERGWDVERKGLSGAPRIRVIAGPERHGTIDRALRFIGMGTDCIERIAGDPGGRLNPDALDAVLASQPGAPAIVLLQAGDINTGAFDDFTRVIPVAKAHGAWVHVDGAFGLWGAVSREWAPYLRGVELADSWATDGHKWLNVPYDSGFAIVADARAHRAAVSHTASYLTHAPNARDQLDYNAEWSRRARGFAAWAAFRELGRDGLSALVARCCVHARSLVERIGALDGAAIVGTHTLNQGLVRFSPANADGDLAAGDRYTDEIMERVRRSGEAFFTGTTWGGRRAMRISVCSWRTTDRDIDRAVEAVRVALGAGA